MLFYFFRVEDSADPHEVHAQIISDLMFMATVLLNHYANRLMALSHISLVFSFK
jgi:hypothetical protein